MPVPLVPVDRKILLFASAVFAVMVGAALFLIRGTDSNDNNPTVYSAGSGGCKAAFLLLKESGYHAQTWERPLRDLPDGKDKILLLVEPAAFPAREEKQRLELFLKTGGRLIAAGQFSAFYLPINDSVPDPLSTTTWKRVTALSPSPITHAAAEISMTAQAFWRANSSGIGLYGDADKPVVVEYTIGKGKVLWLAGSTPLSNAGLMEGGSLEFLLAAIGPPEKNTILWDEYIHGFTHSTGISRSNRLIGWIVLQFALFAVAILLAYSRRSGPVWIPESETRLSPLEFVHTLGLLYENAHAGGIAVDISSRRFRYMLTRRLGLSGKTSVNDLVRAVRERRTFKNTIPDQDLAATLLECESSRYDPNVKSSAALRLVQALFDYATRLKLVSTQHKEKTTWKQS